MKVPSLLLALFWSLLPPFSVASEPEPNSGSSVNSGSNVRDTDLRALLREVGTRTHKHFIMDPRGPSTVDLGDLKVQDVSYSQLLSILRVYGMVVAADGGMMQVLPDADARQTSMPLVEPDNIKTLDDEWVQTVLPLKSISAAQLVPILRPLLPQNAHMAALTDRNSLMIIDRSANVRRIVELVRTLEKLPKVADAPTQKTP